MLQLMHSFHGNYPPQAVLDAVKRGEIGAFCLFRYNVESPAQLRTLTEALYHAAQSGNQPPPLIGIDQEGGQLMAVMEGATELPGSMALGATRSPALASQAGYVLGRELLAMGINLNFAPVLDVNNNPFNPGIGVRSFGDNPSLASDLGIALITAMQAQGVLATAKHFPGSGDVSTDTHFHAAAVHHMRARLDQFELAPFRAAIAAGVKAIMSAHIHFPALDPDYPATLSRRILTDLLRGELGYQGLIITDAMDMQAVAAMGVEHTLGLALQAGVDLALLGHLPNQLALNQHFAAQVNAESVARQLALRRTLPTQLPDLSVVGSPEHQAIAQAIAEQAITLVRGAENLPLRLGPDQTLAVITPIPENLTPADTSAEVNIRLADAIRQRHSRTNALQIQRDMSDSHLGEVLHAVADAAVIIIGTINAAPDSGQAKLVRALQAAGKRPIAIALRTPYDLMGYPDVETYLCTYSIRAASIEAVTRVLFGEIPASGVLPCEIPGTLMQG